MKRTFFAVPTVFDGVMLTGGSDAEVAEFIRDAEISDATVRHDRSIIGGEIAADTCKVGWRTPDGRAVEITVGGWVSRYHGDEGGPFRPDMNPDATDNVIELVDGASFSIGGYTFTVTKDDAAE